MNRIKQFIVRYPVPFSLLITVLVLVLYILVTIVAEVAGSTVIQKNFIEAAGRMIAAGLFAGLIFLLGWQKSSGLTRPGTLAAWLLAALILVYEALTHVYPLLLDANFGGGISSAEWAIFLNALTTGFMEEIPFRGLVLLTLVKAWGEQENGIMKSVLASAVIFGASHLIHLFFGRDPALTLLIAISTILAGIYYAAIVLRWNSLWPVIAIHGLLNGVVALVELNVARFVEPRDMLIIVLLQIPVVILGLYLLPRPRPVVGVPKPA